MTAVYESCDFSMAVTCLHTDDHVTDDVIPNLLQSERFSLYQCLQFLSLLLDCVPKEEE
jgi:hypothetical protein